MDNDSILAIVLDATVAWREVERGGEELEAEVEGHACRLRMNDFPAESLYTLTVGDERIDFDDAPPGWTIPPMPA